MKCNPPAEWAQFSVATIWLGSTKKKEQKVQNHTKSLMSSNPLYQIYVKYTQ